MPPFVPVKRVYLVEVRALTEDEIYVSVYWHKTEMEYILRKYLRGGGASYIQRRRERQWRGGGGLG
jgi:hypothetical protein